MADGFALYTEVVVGVGAKLRDSLAGRPWADVTQNSAVKFTTEAEMVPQYDKVAKVRTETRPQKDFYQSGWYLPHGSFALRPIVSGNRRIAGLWLQNF